MKYKTYIDSLLEESKRIQERTNEILLLDKEVLKKRANKNSWNILECYEHLWYYSSLYNKNMSKAISKAEPLKSDFEVKHGLMGGKFIKMMNPNTEGKIKKMNTFKSKNPIRLNLDKSSIEKFLEANNQTIEICKKTLEKNAMTVKSTTAIPMLKLRLADALGFIIAHNTRHLLQVEKCLTDALRN